MEYDYYTVACVDGVVNNGVVHVRDSIIEAARVDPPRLKALIADGSLVGYGSPVASTDTGKTPPKEPHPEQIEDERVTKVIEPTVRKGGRR